MAGLAQELARCWPWIVAALEHDEHRTRPEAAWEAITSGEAQLWPGESGALVTQLLRTDHGAEVHCWLGGGTLQGLLELRPAVEAWGRAHGAQRATINGRRGWDRIFLRFGYTREGGQLVKAL